MLEVSFETARLLAYCMAIVMVVSAGVYGVRRAIIGWREGEGIKGRFMAAYWPDGPYRSVSVPDLHRRSSLLGLMVLFTFTYPLFQDFNVYLDDGSNHPFLATAAVHILIILQIFLWSTIADNPKRIRKIAFAAYPLCLLIVVAHKAGL